MKTKTWTSRDITVYAGVYIHPGRHPPSPPPPGPGLTRATGADGVLHPLYPPPHAPPPHSQRSPYRLNFLSFNEKKGTIQSVQHMPTVLANSTCQLYTHT